MVHDDVYAQMLREWRKKGSNVLVLNLQRVQILGAIPDSYPWKEKILLNVYEFWTQYGSIYHVSYCWGYTR